MIRKAKFLVWGFLTITIFCALFAYAIANFVGLREQSLSVPQFEELIIGEDNAVVLADTIGASTHQSWIKSGAYTLKAVDKNGKELQGMIENDGERLWAVGVGKFDIVLKADFDGSVTARIPTTAVFADDGIHYGVSSVYEIANKDTLNAIESLKIATSSVNFKELEHFGALKELHFLHTQTVNFSSVSVLDESVVLYVPEAKYNDYVQSELFSRMFPDVVTNAENAAVVFDLAGGTITGQDVYSGRFFLEHKTGVFESTAELCPSRKGFKFLGWTKEGDTALLNENSIISANIKLVAAWIDLAYKLRFDVATGEPIDDMDITYGQSLILPAAQREGYVFSHWTLPNGERLNSGSVPDLGEHNSTVILTAQWIPREYSVVYDKNQPESASQSVGGDMTDSTHSFDMTRALTQNEYTLTGWIFTGWNTIASGDGDSYLDGQNVTNLIAAEEFATSDSLQIVLYAQWQATQYIITYEYNGASEGNQAQTATVFYDSEFVLAVPEKSGVRFTGWYDGEGRRYTDDNGSGLDFWRELQGKTLYAGWIAGLIFNYEDADEGTETAFIETTEGQAVGELPWPQKENYSFEGWWTLPSGGGVEFDADTLAGAKNQELYAKWVMEIPFDYQGGTGSGKTSMSVVYKTPMGTLPATQKTGNEFMGWFTAAGGEGEKYTGSTELLSETQIRLYAAWQTTLTFDYQEGSGNTLSLAVMYGRSVSYSGDLPNAERSDYIFAGWFTKAGGKGEEITDGDIYDFHTPITVYAAWKTTITYNYQGGKESDSYKEVFWDTEIGELAVTQKTGHKFMGWWTAQAGTGEKYTNETVFTGTERTLYAYWIIERYEIRFEAGMGTSVQPITKTYGTYLSASEIPSSTLAQNEFDYWLLPTGEKLVSGTVGDWGDWKSDDTSLPITVTVSAFWKKITAIFYGQGTEEKPYEIRYDYQMKDLEERVNKGNNFAGKYFKLTNDINLGGNWTPIGNNNFEVYYSATSDAVSRRFAGTFDGAGKTISGYAVNLNGITGTAQQLGDTYNGLFGYIAKDGVVKNLTVKDFSITGKSSRTAGKKGGTHHGAIAGVNSGSILNCETSQGSTVGGSASLDTHHGGIAGYMFLQGARIVDCKNFATVGGSAGRCTSHGGIVGSVNNGVIYECKNSGNVSGSYDSTLYSHTTGDNYARNYQFYGGIAGVACAVIANCEYVKGTIGSGNVPNYGSSGSGLIVGYLHNGSDTSTNSDSTDTLKINKTVDGLSYYSAIINCTGTESGTEKHVGLMQSDSSASDGKQPVAKIGTSSFKAQNSGNWYTAISPGYYDAYLSKAAAINAMLADSYIVVPEQYLIGEDGQKGGAWESDYDIKPQEVLLITGVALCVAGAILMIVLHFRLRKKRKGE